MLVVPLVWAAFLETARSSTAPASRRGFHYPLKVLPGLLSLRCSTLCRFAAIVLLHCLLAGLRLAETVPVMTIENYTTEDASTRPLAERLEPEPSGTQDKVAVPSTLAGGMGTNEVSGR
jgi:hypothetical protein